MPFEIVRNNIAHMQADAIVNAASRFPRVNFGVDSAIHQAAGPALLSARREIGFIAPGDAAITPAFDLNAKYVIHAATPTWVDGLHREVPLLRQAYDRCLKLALDHNCKSIAFPLLASGNHGFPAGKALQVAVSAFSEFLLEHDLQIYLVVFSKESLHLSKKLVQNVTSYIDENYVTEYVSKEKRCFRALRRVLESEEDSFSAACAPLARQSQSLNDYLKEKDAGFIETLLQLIEKTGQKNSTIYKKANISKQHFSKLLNDPNAKPSKPTAIALALALELDLDATKDLIGRAGYALTNSSTFDLIIRYFIEHRQYNVIEINMTLYEFDQALLGA